MITKWTTKPKVEAIEGDILITVKGAGLGKLNAVDVPKVAISRQLMAIRPFEIVNEYIFLYLQSRFDFFQQSGVGIAIPGLSRTQINTLLFSLPPLAEQKRIVARVEDLLALCDALASEAVAAEEVRSHLLGAVLNGA